MAARSQTSRGYLLCSLSFTVPARSVARGPSDAVAAAVFTIGGVGLLNKEDSTRMRETVQFFCAPCVFVLRVCGGVSAVARPSPHAHAVVRASLVGC